MSWEYSDIYSMNNMRSNNKIRLEKITIQWINPLTPPRLRLKRES